MKEENLIERLGRLSSPDFSVDQTAAWKLCLLARVFGSKPTAKPEIDDMIEVLIG